MASSSAITGPPTPTNSIVVDDDDHDHDHDNDRAVKNNDKIDTSAVSNNNTAISNHHGPDPDHDDPNHRSGVVWDKAVKHLVTSCGINFVAIDFDQTILNVHTGGIWNGTIEELIEQHVRSEFQILIPKLLSFQQQQQQLQDDDDTKDSSRTGSGSALHCHNNNNNNGIDVAVVTFSSQIHIVRSVLDHIVGYSTSSIIPIRGGMCPEPSVGGCRNWLPNDYDLNYDTAKQTHMISAVLEIERRQQQESKDNIRNTITPATTLLIDDDEFNVDVARENGVRGIVFDPKQPSTLLDNLLSLL